MEPRKDLSAGELGDAPTPDDPPQEYFRKSRDFAEKHYLEDMLRIWSTKLEDVSPDFFFLEYVWVVHATGFNAKVVAKMLPKLVEAYGIDSVGGWLKLASRKLEDVLESVLKVCNNPAKAKAVHRTASMMKESMFPEGDGKVETWEEFRQRQLSSPELLTELPYVGNVTCYHLARNIGILECVKPDLHLVRLASHWGFKDSLAMCEAMRPPGMPLGIVDLILWYAASTFGTLGAREAGGR